MEKRILMGKASKKLLDLLKDTKLNKPVVIGVDKNGNDIIFTKTK